MIITRQLPQLSGALSNEPLGQTKKYQLLRSTETETLKLDDREGFQLPMLTQKGINEDNWVGCPYEKMWDVNNWKNTLGVDHLT